MTQKHKVIGIDLGTTYSAVAAYDGYTEQAEIIKDGGEVTTPSVVSIDSRTGRVIVGRAAKQNLAVNPRDTVIEIKREMGELFSRETLDKYRVPAGRFSEKEPVHARLGGDDEWFLPQQVSAFILMRMKEIAESDINEEIRDAVVTVPAYFTANQRKATEEAALMAGLYPRQLIPEPTAAAICYGVDRMEPQRRVYLVYDLGGGTFDVSIIEVEGGNISVIATSGDPRLGGSDFDDRITAWATEELRSKHGIDVSADPLARARIKYQAEDLKIKLSTYEQAEMPLLWLRPQQPPVLVLTRDVFVQMIGDLLAKSLNSVEAALKSADAKGVRREDVSAILLVGGSTNIPAAKHGLLEYFRKPKEFVRDDLDPAAVVARGAAILAHRFAPSPPPFDVKRQTQSTELNREADMSQSIRLITEHSLGVKVNQADFDCLIRQGTNLPVQVTKGGYVNGGPTTHIPVEVFQGEAPIVYNNTQIGIVQVGPMEPREAGFHRFELTYALDANGLLSVQVRHLNTGQVYQGHFEHQTSVKGVEALAVMRDALLRLYQPGATTASLPPLPAAGVPAPGYAPPPAYGPSTSPPAGYAPPPAPGAPSAYVPPPPPVPAAGYAPPQTPGPPPWAPPATVAAPTPAPVTAPPSPPPAAAAGVLEPTREMPEALKSIVRRSKKQLLQKPDAELLARLNALVEAINAGRSVDELNDLGDELENAYHDARKHA